MISLDELLGNQEQPNKTSEQLDTSGHSQDDISTQASIDLHPIKDPEDLNELSFFPESRFHERFRKWGYNCETLKRDEWSLNYPYPIFKPFGERYPEIKRRFPAASNISLARALYESYPCIKDVIRRRYIDMSIELYLFVICSPLFGNVCDNLDTTWFSQLEDRFIHNRQCFACGGYLHRQGVCRVCDWQLKYPPKYPADTVFNFRSPVDLNPKYDFIIEYMSSDSVHALVSMMLFLPPARYVTSFEEPLTNMCYRCGLSNLAWDSSGNEICHWCAPMDYSRDERLNKLSSYVNTYL